MYVVRDGGNHLLTIGKGKLGNTSISIDVYNNNKKTKTKKNNLQS